MKEMDGMSHKKYISGYHYSFSHDDTTPSRPSYECINPIVHFIDVQNATMIIELIKYAILDICVYRSDH